MKTKFRIREASLKSFEQISPTVDIACGDCLELMDELSRGGVDMVLCDLPYGVTACKWDTAFPVEMLWRHYERVNKKNGAIVLFSIQPFTTDLIQSNRQMFKYEIVWEKTQQTGFYNAKKAPLRIHENIEVFYREQPTYNPQMWIKETANIGHIRTNSDYKKTNGGSFGKVSKKSAETWQYIDDGSRYPLDVIKFSNWNGALFGRTENATKHPTQKPVALLEYLIRTYTNPGDVVLDNCMGSGSTGVACINTDRRFIGIEIDRGYYEIAKKRLTETAAQLKLFTEE